LIKSIIKFIKEFSGEITPEDSHVDVEQDPISGQFVPKIDGNIMERFKLLPEGQSLGASSRNPQIAFPQEPIEQPINTSNIPSSSSSNELDGNKQKQLVGLRNDLNASWHLIDNTLGSMALFRTSQGVIGFHCQAAYERIRYEQLEDSFEEKNKSESQKLLFAESLELNSVESGILQKSFSQLKNVGFTIEEFGRNFYRLIECPSWIEPVHAKAFLMDFVEIASDSGGAGEIERFAKEAITRLATENSGVKNSFSENEVVHIANQLFTCRNPYTCPKGRPTYFELPIRDFENRFQRKI
jgi:DNA mismatch repair protein MutL